MPIDPAKAVRHVVYLPASAPRVTRYGHPSLETLWADGVLQHVVPFDRQVWYNAAIRRQVLAWLDSLEEGPLVLVGFSKSGLGAMNLALEPSLRKRLRGVVIFDAPVSTMTLPPWETADFYTDDLAWQADLPLLRVNEYARVFDDACRLVMISGEYFAPQMRELADALAAAGVVHDFLDQPTMAHHWQSGWLELAQASLAPRRR